MAQEKQIIEDEEQDGVETEPADASLEIDRPFEPEKIKVRTESRVVEQIVSRIAHNEIDLAPDFQRLRGVWDQIRKSRLIESLLLRIPLPVFYVAADAGENWAVVDGLQRMSTMDDFIQGQFKLASLEYLTQFNGKTFNEIPRAMQRRINETQLLIHVIDAGTPEEVMFNIFSRINTGGVRLNGQEIRHALNRGPVRDFLRDLANEGSFLAATAGTVKQVRMADRECVLRFLAFTIDPWEQYASNDLDGFLGSAMKKINVMDGAARGELGLAFNRSMWAAHSIFGGDAFRKRYRKGDRTNPVSKALFEAWSVQLARCTNSQLEVLKERRADVQQAFMDLMVGDRDFDVSISYSTGSRQRVEKRFGAIRDLLLGIAP